MIQTTFPSYINQLHSNHPLIVSTFTLKINCHPISPQLEVLDNPKILILIKIAIPAIKPLIKIGDHNTHTWSSTSSLITDTWFSNSTTGYRPHLLLLMNLSLHFPCQHCITLFTFKSFWAPYPWHTPSPQAKCEFLWQISLVHVWDFLVYAIYNRTLWPQIIVILFSCKVVLFPTNSGGPSKIPHESSWTAKLLVLQRIKNVSWTELAKI